MCKAITWRKKKFLNYFDTSVTCFAKKKKKARID